MEFVAEQGNDGRLRAVDVTGPGGANPQVSIAGPRWRCRTILVAALMGSGWLLVLPYVPTHQVARSVGDACRVGGLLSARRRSKREYKGA